MLRGARCIRARLLCRPQAEDVDTMAMAQTTRDWRDHPKESWMWMTN